MDKNNIKKIVLFPYSKENNEMIKISLDILKHSKKNNFIIPFLRISPKKITSEKFDELLNMGFKGVKLHPRSEDFDILDESVFWVYEKLSKKGLPLLFHTKLVDENAKPEKALEIARKFPNLKIVIGHFLGGNMDLIEKASKLGNIYIETSIYGTSRRIKDMVENYNLKLIFGSDMPYDTQASIMKVIDSGLSEKQIEDILFRNAEELLNSSKTN